MLNQPLYLGHCIVIAMHKGKIWHILNSKQEEMTENYLEFKYVSCAQMLSVVQLFPAPSKNTGVGC